MPNCAICGENTGAWFLKNVKVEESSFLPSNEARVCSNCFELITRIKNGEKDAFLKVQELVKQNVSLTESDFTEKLLIFAEKKVEEVENRKAEEEARRIEKEELEQRKEEIKKNFIISTTPVLEGYRITKYLGILPISSASSSFFDISLYAMSVNDKIKDLAIAMGGNAVVGMTYTTKMEEVLGIGTVVWIEKID